MLMGVHSYRIGGGRLRAGLEARDDHRLHAGPDADDLGQRRQCGRPVTAAAHEFGHALGFPHAHTTCPGEDGTPEPGEPWPTDNGACSRAPASSAAIGSAASRWQVRPDGSTPVYDLMSYCGDETNSWLSARNWNRSFAVLQALAAARRTHRSFARAAQRAAQAGQALALGAVGPTGARIERVIPADPENLAPASDPRSPLRVRALDAGGKLLGEVAADVQMLRTRPTRARSSRPSRPGRTWSSCCPARRPWTAWCAHGPRRCACWRPPRRASHGSRPAGGALEGERSRRRRPACHDRLRRRRQELAHGLPGSEHAGARTFQGALPDAGSRARLRVTVDDGFARRPGHLRPLPCRRHAAGGADRPAGWPASRRRPDACSCRAPRSTIAGAACAAVR